MDIEKIIRQYLPQVVHMSLATCKDDRPWVCEVHFAFDDDLNLYFRSLTSRRHSQEIAANPNVAGNIVTQHFLDQPVRAVYFEGTAELLASEADRAVAFELFRDRLHVGEEVLEDTNRPDGGQFYKITIENFYVYDSITSSPSQKYELKWHGGKK